MSKITCKATDSKGLLLWKPLLVCRIVSVTVADVALLDEAYRSIYTACEVICSNSRSPRYPVIKLDNSVPVRYGWVSYTLLEGKIRVRTFRRGAMFVSSKSWETIKYWALSCILGILFRLHRKATIQESYVRGSKSCCCCCKSLAVACNYLEAADTDRRQSI